jgi:hypothetical protein
MVCLVTEEAYLDTDPTNTTATVLSLVDLPFTTSTTISPIAFPTLVLNFFQGLWRILIWDYSFWDLNPALQIVRIVFCYPITFFAMWGLVQIFIGTVTNLLG